MKGVKSTEVTVFEEKHMISILTFLGSNGPSRKIDIYEGVSSNPRMPDKLNHLEEIGLLTQRTDMSSRSTIVTLTPAGEQIASLFVAIEKCLINNRGLSTTN
jgi:hypothetical protein